MSEAKESDMTENLLDHLQEQGYEPDMGRNPDWYDLVASGTGTVRVTICPDDGYRAEVYFFDAHMVCEWDVQFSPGAPDAVILATIEAAEQQLAAKRGGPVTPAQESARPLAEVRAVFAGFDWERDDRQYALEAIEAIVTKDA